MSAPTTYVPPVIPAWLAGTNNRTHHNTITVAAAPRPAMRATVSAKLRPTLVRDIQISCYGVLVLQPSPEHAPTCGKGSAQPHTHHTTSQQLPHPLVEAYCVVRFDQIERSSSNVEQNHCEVCHNNHPQRVSQQASSEFRPSTGIDWLGTGTYADEVSHHYQHACGHGKRQARKQADPEGCIGPEAFHRCSLLIGIYLTSVAQQLENVTRKFPTFCHVFGHEKAPHTLRRFSA